MSSKNLFVKSLLLTLLLGVSVPAWAWWWSKPKPPTPAPGVQTAAQAKAAKVASINAQYNEALKKVDAYKKTLHTVKERKSMIYFLQALDKYHSLALRIAEGTLVVNARSSIHVA